VKIPYNEPLNVARGTKRWERPDTANLVFNFDAREHTISQPEFAEKKRGRSIDAAVLGYPKKQH